MVTSRPEVIVQRKVIRAPIEKDRAAPHAPAPKKKATRTNLAYVVVPQNTTYRFTQEEEVFVLVRAADETTVMTAANSVVATKKGD